MKEKKLKIFVLEDRYCAIRNPRVQYVISIQSLNSTILSIYILYSSRWPEKTGLVASSRRANNLTPVLKYGTRSCRGQVGKPPNWIFLLIGTRAEGSQLDYFEV